MWALPVVLFCLQACLIFCPVPKLILQATGIRRHELYTDNHFTRPYPILRFVAHEGSRQFEIPTFNQKDCHLNFPDSTGRYYVSVNFRLRGNWRNEQEIFRYVNGWMSKVGMKPDYVEVFCKDTLLPLELDLDFDNQLLTRPWLHAGRISFAPGQMQGRLVFDSWYSDSYPKEGVLPNQRRVAARQKRSAIR